MPTTPEYAKLIREVEKRFGLPNDVFYQIAGESDWSFLVKSHAIVEAAVTHALSTATDPKLHSRFSRLDLSDIRIGKLSFLSDLGDLDAETKSFLRKLSELRNGVVHDIAQMNFAFKDYIASLDSAQRERFREFCGFHALKYPAESRAESLRKCLDEPKMCIITGVVQVVSKLYGNTLRREVDKEQERIDRNLAREMRNVFGYSDDGKSSSDDTDGR